MELCIGIQAALACLAILSRIHFSKYKDGDIKGLKHIREEVQALRVLTRREAQTLVRTRVKQLVWTTIAILFASTCIAEGLLFKNMQQSERLDTQVVKRTNYDGKVKTEDIRLSVDDKEYTYTMEIEPREYTEEEFYQQAQQRITELESEILGDNPDLEHVSRSLNLPGGGCNRGIYLCVEIRQSRSAFLLWKGRLGGSDRDGDRAADGRGIVSDIYDRT
ncbi:MAG: hypothetical protein ACLSHP_05995 [Coprococcus sp.]